MTQLTNKSFFDEYENFFEIKHITKKKRYKRPFQFLYIFFNHNQRKCVTIKMLQENLGIIDRSEAFQILESFQILNLLKKDKTKGRVRYIPTNIEWWGMANKELEKIEEIPPPQDKDGNQQKN